MFLQFGDVFGFVRSAVYHCSGFPMSGVACVCVCLNCKNESNLALSVQTKRLNLLGLKVVLMV